MKGYFFSNCMPDFYQLFEDEQFGDIVQNINQQTYQKYIQLCKTTDGINPTILNLLEFLSLNCII